MMSFFVSDRCERKMATVNCVSQSCWDLAVVRWEILKHPSNHINTPWRSLRCLAMNFTYLSSSCFAQQLKRHRE